MSQHSDGWSDSFCTFLCHQVAITIGKAKGMMWLILECEGLHKTTENCLCYGNF